MKKFLTILMTAVLALGLMVTPVMADQNIDVTDGLTFDEINDDAFCVTQSARGKCTLASSAMIMRRAAMLAGDTDWASITESSLGSVAWRGGVGIGWEFSMHGLTMVHDYVSSTDEIIALLKAHPEGIVAYDSCQPHAIALLDYDEESGIFYCCDPSETYPKGRYNITRSMVSIENVDVVWYVTNDLPALVEEGPESVSQSPMPSITDSEMIAAELGEI